MSSSEKKNTFFGGAAILTVGVILVKLIGALYKIPLGNILSDEAFADFTAAYNIYNLFLTVSTAGLPVALSKSISEAHALRRENQMQRTFQVAMMTFFVLGLISFIIMAFFAQPLANAMKDPAAVYCIIALSPSVFCVCMMSSFRGYAQGQSNMVPTTVSQVIESLGKLVVGLALASMVVRMLADNEAYAQQMAAAGAIFGVSVGGIVALIYMIIQFLHRARGRVASHDVPDPSSTIFSRLLKLAIPITIGSAAVSIVTLVDTTLVLYQLQKMYTALPELITQEALDQALDPEKGIEAVLYMARGLKGIYDKCMTIYNLPSALMVPLTASVIPAVSACLTRRDRQGAGRISESTLRVGALICLPAGAGMFALAGPIVGLLFPSLDQDVATNLMSILSIASVFVCIMLICNSILQAHGIVNLPVVTVIIGGVIKIVVNYVLVGNYNINIQGAPVGTLCCFGVVALLDLFIIKRVIPSPPNYTKVFAKPLVASIVMGFAAWSCHGLLTHFLHLGSRLAAVAAVLVGVVVYLVLVVALRIISKDDLALMPKGDKIAKILHIE